MGGKKKKIIRSNDSHQNHLNDLKNKNNLMVLLDNYKIRNNQNNNYNSTKKINNTEFYNNNFWYYKYLYFNKYIIGNSNIINNNTLLTKISSNNNINFKEDINLSLNESNKNFLYSNNKINYLNNNSHNVIKVDILINNKIHLREMSVIYLRENLIKIFVYDNLLRPHFIFNLNNIKLNSNRQKILKESNFSINSNYYSIFKIVKDNNNLRKGFFYLQYLIENIYDDSILDNDYKFYLIINKNKNLELLNQDTLLLASFLRDEKEIHKFKL